MTARIETNGSNASASAVSGYRILKLAEYRRVSSTGQAADGYGLDVQAEHNRAWARSSGHKIAGQFSDDGISGAKGADVVDGINLEARPGLKAALDMIAAGDADGLLVPRMDRLGRALHVQEAVLAWVWRRGGHVFAADQGEILQDDPGDPLRTTIRKMIALFNELDRAMTVKRMADGRKIKAAAGKHATGAYAFGWHGEGRGRDRDAAPFEDEQAAVELITSLRRQGASYRQIVGALEDAGIPPRRAAHWSSMTVRNIAVRELAR